MTVLSLDPPALLDPASVGSDVHAMALAAYRQTLLGLHTRGRRKMTRALARFEDADASVELGAVMWLAGMAARCRGSWGEAAGWLNRASATFRTTDALEHAGLAAALEIDALAVQGELQAAKSRLTVVRDELSDAASLTTLASAAFHLARGDVEEASTFAAELSSSHPIARAWATLLRCESELEGARGDKTREALAELVSELESARAFDEAHARALYLLARHDAERWLEDARTESAPPSKLLRLLRRARTYAERFSRYGVLLDALEAQLETVRDPRRGAGLAERAIQGARDQGALLDEARILQRHADVLQQRATELVGDFGSRASARLSRLGATRRAASTTRPGSSNVTPTGTAFTLLGGAGKDSLQRSVLTDARGRFDIELEAVFNVNRAISSTLETRVLMQRILEEILRVLKLDRGAILRSVDGRLECIAGRHIDPERFDEEEGISLSVVDAARRSGETVTTTNAMADERFRESASILASDIRRAMCTPLTTASRTYGYLYVDSVGWADDEGQLRRELLEIFATQAAVSLENAQAFEEIHILNRDMEQKVIDRTAELRETNRKLQETIDDLENTRLALLAAEKEVLEREMQLAREVQETLIPSDGTRECEGVVIHGHLQTATRVSGDFWTYLPLDAERTLVLIGDATGHGVAAGMVTATLRAAIESYLRTAVAFDMRDCLALVSAVIHASTQGRMGTTATAVVIDPEHRTLEVGQAGHQPPYFVTRGDGMPHVETVTLPPSTPLGTTNGEYAVLSRSYEAGDRLLLYSDGIPEAVNTRGRQFGHRRFQKAVLAHAESEPHVFVQGVLEALDSFCSETPPDDDRTLVCLALE